MDKADLAFTSAGARFQRARTSKLQEPWRTGIDGVSPHHPVCGTAIELRPKPRGNRGFLILILILILILLSFRDLESKIKIRIKIKKPKVTLK